MSNNYQPRGPGATAEAPGTKAYRVHLYLSVRVPVDVHHAATQLEAIDVALRSTDLPTAACAGTFADEVIAAMVDEVGDEHHIKSTTYAPGQLDAQPWVDVAQRDQTESLLTGPTTSRYLDLSTQHVTKQTMAWLCKGPNAATAGLGATIAPYQYGVIVGIPSDIPDLTAIDDVECPEDLKVILRFGRSIGCDLVRLDQDAALSGQLPIYAV
ncbi:MAG: hypothetical protein EPN77_19415 [Candidimonas sp.]|nr:MAG: hypothetical protein EPN77_19415 [Candidimonas sp.]